MKTHQKRAAFSKFLTPLLVAFILIVPLNLFYKLGEENSFVNGLQIDYLILKIYLIDLLVALMLISWVFFQLWGRFFADSKKQNLLRWFKTIIVPKVNRFSRQSLPLLLVLLALVIRQLMTPQPEVAVFAIAQWLIVFSAGYFLYQQRAVLRSSTIAQAIISSFLIQFGLGVYQFFAQRPLLPYPYLGEPRFEPYYRLSRHIFNGQERILAYASTAHPNILAAVGTLFFLMTSLYLKQQLKIKKNKKNQHHYQLTLLTIFLILVLLLIYITQAKTALVTLVLGSLLIWSQQLNLKFSAQAKKIGFWAIMIGMPILIAIMSQTHSYEPSIFRRHALNLTAINMWADQMFLGQGLNQFTIYLEKFGQTAETIRFVQPTHHVGLLWLAEAGLLGVWLAILSYQLLDPKLRSQLLAPILIISPLLATDHFFYSLQPSRMLLILFLVYWIAVEKGRFSAR